MCEQLTSCAIKVVGEISLAIHTTNSHSKTWDALKLETRTDRCAWRELQWLERVELPDVRWRTEDDDTVKHRVMDWLAKHFPTRISLVVECCLKAEYVDASGCTGLTELKAPKAQTVYARGCTGLTEIDAPKESIIR